MPTETEIDLRPFCELEEDAFFYDDFCKPFVIGGWKYATDRFRAIRVLSGEPDTEGVRQKVSELVTSLFEKFSSSNEWKPLPDSSTGKTEKHDCELCQGKGVRFGRVCILCDGKASVQVLGDITLGETVISGDNFELIATLPNPKFAEQPKLILVQFDGGQAAVAAKS